MFLCSGTPNSGRPPPCACAGSTGVFQEKSSDALKKIQLDLERPAPSGGAGVLVLVFVRVRVLAPAKRQCWTMGATMWRPFKRPAIQRCIGCVLTQTNGACMGGHEYGQPKPSQRGGWLGSDGLARAAVRVMWCPTVLARSVVAVGASCAPKPFVHSPRARRGDHSKPPLDLKDFDVPSCSRVTHSISCRASALVRISARNLR